MRIKLSIVAAVSVVTLIGAACGGSDDSGSSGKSDTPAPSQNDNAGSPTANQPTGGGGGTLVIGDETIVLDRARCYLQEQDVVGSPGKILFTGQGYGTTAAGEDLVVDITRWNEESLFTGDDITVDIGDPFSDDAVSLLAHGDIGTVMLSGSTLSASDLTFTGFDDITGMVEEPGSIEINC